MASMLPGSFASTALVDVVRKLRRTARQRLPECAKLVHTGEQMGKARMLTNVEGAPVSSFSWFLAVCLAGYLIRRLAHCPGAFLNHV